MKDRKTGQPRGFGFITYADPSVVDTVIEDTHIINGKQVIIDTRLNFESFLVLIVKDLKEGTEQKGNES